MRTKLITLFIITAIAVISVTIARLSSQKEEITNEPLRIGFNSWIGHGIYFVAREKRVWDEEGLTVELKQIDDIAVSKQLLGSGGLDAISWTPETIQTLGNADIKVKVVLATDVSDGADGIIASKEIETLENLRGTRVAYEPTSPSHFFLSFLLNQKGLTTNDLATINLTAPDAGAAFVAEKADAAVTWEPWLSKAGEREGGHLIASSKDIPILPALPTFREEVVTMRRDDVKKYMRGIFKAMDYARTHPDETREIIGRNFNLTPNEVEEQLSTFKWIDYRENLAYFSKNKDSVYEVINTAGDLWLKLELIQKKTVAEDVIDATLLKELYQ